MLFAAGAVLVEHLGGRAGVLVKGVYVALLLLSGILLAPLAMPILPPATFVDDYGFMSGTGNTAAGQQTQGALPQYFGDRFGWETMTRTVAGVYEKLPTEQRGRACIFTSNYGEASALNFLGGQHHLPPAISGHNSYYLWGPDGCTGEVMITIGVPRGDLEQVYAGVEKVATVGCRYCMPEENEVPVYLAKGPKVPIRELWPRTKHYD
jgi:hypothetical protein